MYIIFTEKRGKTRNGNIFCVKIFFFVISRKFFYTYSVINIVWIVVEKKIKYVLECSWCVLLAKWMSLSKYLLIFEKLTQTFVQFFFTQTLVLLQEKNSFEQDIILQLNTRELKKKKSFLLQAFSMCTLSSIYLLDPEFFKISLYHTR